MIDFNADPRSYPTPVSRRAPFVWGAGLILLILLNSIVALRWLKADTRPLAWDEALHTQNTFEYRDRLATKAELLQPVYFNYPPLYNLTLVPFLSRSSDIADAGAHLNLIYLGALMLAVFLIGLHLMDGWSGLAAAALIGFYPLVIMMTHVTILDLALTSWVAWAFYALMRADNFSNVGWSAAFGAFLGLGMLTKYTAFIYLAGPAAVALVAALKRREYGSVAVSGAVTAAVMAPWYMLNIIPMIVRVTALKDMDPASGLILTGAARFLWYPIGLFEQMNLPFVLLFVVGLVLAFRQPRLRPLLLWFFVSIVMFTLINNRNTRYSLPALPAAALLSVSWIHARRARFVGAMVLALGFFGLFHFSALPAMALPVGQIRLPLFERRPAIHEDWKHSEIIAAVRAQRNAAAPFSRIVVVANAPYLHSTTLNASARRLGPKNFAFRGASKRRWMDFAEFILLKTGDLGPAGSIKTIQEHAAWLAQPPAWFPLIYREAGRWPLPDGSEAILYHAEPQPRPISENENFSISLTDIILPNLTASNVDVRATPLSAEATSRGTLAAVEITCSSVSFKGLDVTGVALSLDHPQINLPRYRDESDVQLLALNRLSIKGEINAETILAYARKKAKWLKEPFVVFDGDIIRVGGKAGPVKIDIAVRLTAEPDYLRPVLQSLRIGGVPIPTILFRSLTDRPIQLSPNRESPFRIDIGHLSGAGNILKVGR